MIIINIILRFIPFVSKKKKNNKNGKIKWKIDLKLQ